MNTHQHFESTEVVAAPPVDRVRTRDGADLFVRDWGEGRPVLFVHAWALPSDMWTYQMAPLSDAGYRCVAFDRRGHGRSGDPGRGYDYDTLSDDMAAVIAALDLRDLTIVSHSFGTGEVVRYLTRHGQNRVRSLVFLAPAGPPYLLKTPDNPGGIDGALFEAFRNEVLLHDFPQWLEDGKAAFFTADTSPEMMDWVGALMLQASMKALVECNRAMTTTDFRAELERIARPTLVIHGDRDASSPMEISGRPMAALIPGAEFRPYEGAPHGLFLTHMRRLNADLAAYLAQ